MPWGAGEAAPERFFEILSPPIKRINASRPRITANVTIAPMTPATAFEIPPDPDLDEEDGVAVEALPEAVADEGAQIPVVFPQAAHQSA